MHGEDRFSRGVIDVKLLSSFLDGLPFIEYFVQESRSERLCDFIVFSLSVRSFAKDFHVNFSEDVFDDFHFFCRY